VIGKKVIRLLATQVIGSGRFDISTKG